jgi:hypothetical protein
MNFDPRDLIEANLTLLHEIAQQPEPSPAVLVTVATWGRGADPELLKALQPYRHGLGFNGSIVARVPRSIAMEWLPDGALEKLSSENETSEPFVYAAVFKDWVLEKL